MAERFFVLVLLVPVLCTAALRDRPNGFAARAHHHLLRSLETHDDCSFEADLGRGMTLRVVAETTTKGNGGIRIANLWIQALDMHDDGYVYEGDVLEVRLQRATLFRDARIIVKGVGLVTDESALPGLEKRVPLFAQFRFDSTTRCFAIEEMRSPLPLAWLVAAK